MLYFTIPFDHIIIDPSIPVAILPVCAVIEAQKALFLIKKCHIAENFHQKCVISVNKSLNICDFFLLQMIFFGNKILKNGIYTSFLAPWIGNP